jgi:hypothetical protein
MASDGSLSLTSGGRDFLIQVFNGTASGEILGIYQPWLLKNPGKPSINGPFSMAMLNNQRVYQPS